MRPPLRTFQIPALAVAAVVVAAFHVQQWAGVLSGGVREVSFYSLYTAARLFTQEGAGAVFDVDRQQVAQQAMTAGWQPAAPFLPYVHPPFFTLLVAPIGRLSLADAYLVVAAANLALLAFAILLLARSAWLSGYRALFAALLVAALLPVYAVLSHGESDLFVLAILSIALLLWTRNQEAWAGAVAGLALVKPQLILLIPLLFIARRSWRALGAFTVTGAALVLVSMPAFGLGGWLGYLSILGSWAGGSRAGAITVPTVFSLRDAMESIAVGRPLALTLLAMLLPIGFAALSWRPHRARLDFAIAVAGSLALSPYTNLHDTTLLIVPGFALVGLQHEGSLRWPRLGWAVLAAAYLGLQAPAVMWTGTAFLAALLLTAYLSAERLAVPIKKPVLGPVSLTGRARRVVVLPAYNAERTLRDVVRLIPRDQIDSILLVDDASQDHTARLAVELGIHVIEHPRNLGYGGNQKTCYANALLMGAEVVVMLHPDGQYDPSLVPDLCRAVDRDGADIVLGSRWLGLDPAKAGMPVWKRIGNRFLTWTENGVLGLGLSEYHTGYRAYSRRFLETIPFEMNSNNFVFDTQVLVQAASFGFEVQEIPAVGRYFEDASSIGFRTSVVYGLQTLVALVGYLAHRAGLTSRWLAPRPLRRRARPQPAS